MISPTFVVEQITEKAQEDVNLPCDVANVERIALQAVLGSDRMREFLSLYRHLNGDTDPTLFFEKVQEE